MEKAGASFFYHADGLGSITEITDSLGALKQSYTYSSFGKIDSQLDPASEPVNEMRHSPLEDYCTKSSLG